MKRLWNSILELPPIRQLSRPIRLARQRRDFWKWSDEDQKRLQFYRQFVSENDLVFDIGANVGNRTKVFHQLKSRVVAVEPQRDCAAYIREMFEGRTGVTVVNKAMGSSPGSAELHISRWSTLTTMNPRWIEAVRDSGRFPDMQIVRTETVELDTLDNLIRQFGKPRFLKIDVEGFESSVIAGLHQPVEALSLEIVPEYRENTLECIRHLSSISKCEFQISMLEEMSFSLDGWVDQSKILSKLQELPEGSFGDLYVRMLGVSGPRAAGALP